MTRRSFRRDRRGAVALWIALTVPTLLMALGLGIEVASWSVVQVELQRTADAAALAGSMNYTQTSSGQLATGAAANVAEVNGITGATSRTWNAGTQTLSDNNVTASVVSGIKNSSDVAIKVTVTQNVPLMFANVFSSLGSITITGNAWSELVTNSSNTGAQPCFGALTPASSGGGGITMSGSTTLSDPNCALRSNAGITLSGNGSLNTDGIYAAGSISIPFWVSVTGAEYPSDGTISDPYQSDSALQTALSQLSTSTGSGNACPSCTSNFTGSINPGTYGSFTTTGYSNVTMNPGLYVINGPISFSGNTTISGTGITIISSGNVTVGGSFTGNLTAPGTSPTGGAVPGVLMASTGSSVSFSGGFSFPYTGVLYFPNASVNMSGSTGMGSSGCAELIGGSLTLSGAASFSGNCTSYGAPSYGSLPATTSVSLVQ
jgi:Flp pilus assembly protein TadG